MRPQTGVLVEPPYVCWDRRRDRVRQNEERNPALGVYMVASVLRTHGHRLAIVDGKRTGVSVEQAAASTAHCPAPVGIAE
jgi:hypothetical protein